MKITKEVMRIGLIFLTIILGTLGSCGQSANEVAAFYSDLSLFETPMALALKKGVKKGDIDNMANPQLQQTARMLLAGQYDAEYRSADYTAVLDPAILGNRLMIGDGYSKYENMTGIFLPEGQHTVLVDHIPPGRLVELVVPNWLRKPPEGIEPTEDPAGWGIVSQRFTLHNGINIINLTGFGGLAYIAFTSETPAKDARLAVHFPAAQVNGYFDIAKHDNAHWNRLIDQAVYPIIDARGKHIQVAYPAADCKTFAYGRGMELINNYDSLVYRQHRLMGLEKFKKVPENRILARVNYNYYMFRDGDGVAYMGGKPGYAMPLVVDPDRVIAGDPCWGFSHEVGHVHQLRPSFNWGGLGEVSNNLFSLYVTTSFGNISRIAEQGNYRKARENIIDKGISYLQDPDVFNRLVPFWQLQLYFAGPGDNPDFYPDLFESLRSQGATSDRNRTRSGWGDRGSNPAQYQLDFVRSACHVAGVDLTAFFDQYGFFHVGSFEYEDYGRYRYEMTEEMANTCRAEIAAMELPLPKVDISQLVDR